MRTAILLIAALAGCSAAEVQRTGPCDTDNAGLKLQPGWCARVFSDDAGSARHVVVGANGDVWVAALDRSGGILALRDRDRDGRADTMFRAYNEPGSGIAMRGDTIWFSTSTTVYRFRVDSTTFGKLYDKQVIVQNLPDGGHSSRSLALGDSSDLFVNVGSDSNVCDGKDPCAELSTRASIWRFNRNMPSQTQFGAERYASGIRNAVGLVWNNELHNLFATQHGRDNLEDENLPSEEFMRVNKGDDFGWPYCYHDWRLNKMVLAPEYGGGGVEQGRCATVARPLMGFPGHWAPNGLMFANGGAYIAFHGSWNRRHQDGYRVVFVPFKGALPEGDYHTFADGFAGRRKSPSGADHRPVGLAVATDGSLYITEDQNGRIYNIRKNAENDSTR